jgi:hypothetical protein
VRIRDAQAAASVRRALRSVERRLGDPRCRRVFTDFAGPDGRPLQARLDERGQAPQDYLGTILFYDGSASAPCANRNVLAATSPGNRVVLVCAAQVARARGPREIEAVILHEMLHSLGLEENPPSSAAITARVVARCGF